MLARMTRTTPILRQPYRQRSNAEWDEIQRLYQAGGTAKAVMAQYGGTERTLYARARKYGWLRKDDAPPPRQDEGLTPAEADAAVRALGRGGEVPPADAACRDLAADATLGEAARAAATTAIAMLRDCEAAKSYAFARLAGTLERLARGSAMDGGGGGGGVDPTEPGRRAALDFLRREALREG